MRKVLSSGERMRSERPGIFPGFPSTVGLALGYLATVKDQVLSAIKGSFSEVRTPNGPENTVAV